MKKTILSVLLLLGLAVCAPAQGVRTHEQKTVTTQRMERGRPHFDRHERSWRPERHDRDFFEHRYGGRMKVINGGWYYYENGCWIAAQGYDPEFNSYTEYEICPGDRFYIDLGF